MTGLTLLDTKTASRDEWLSLRKLGSSDASAILGLNPYRTKFQVWLEKTGQAEEREETEAMRWGKRLESVIAEGFAEETGLTIEPSQILVAHPEHGFMTATCDYLVHESDQTGVLEIKNTGAWFAGEWNDRLPDHAHVQVMHQLAVTGLDFAYVAALIGGNSLKWRRIERDEVLIEAIIHAERLFWDLVESKSAPELSAGDSDALNGLFPTSTDSEIAMPERYLEVLERYQEASGKLKAWETEKDQAAAELKEFLGEAERGTCGRFFVSWKTQTRNEKAREARTTTQRVFRIKELKDNGKE